VNSYKVQIQLEKLLSYLIDAETGQRVYIISNESTFLQSYHSARQSIQRPFNTLQILTLENKQQQQNLDTLIHLINLQFNVLSTSLDLNTGENPYKTRLSENMLYGKNVMDSIRG
jgi:CHASE3 domain sensor protein